MLVLGWVTALIFFFQKSSLKWYHGNRFAYCNSHTLGYNETIIWVLWAARLDYEQFSIWLSRDIYQPLWRDSCKLLISVFCKRDTLKLRFKNRYMSLFKCLLRSIRTRYYRTLYVSFNMGSNASLYKKLQLHV